MQSLNPHQAFDVYRSRHRCTVFELELDIGKQRQAIKYGGLCFATESMAIYLDRSPGNIVFLMG